ncbi:precorrin-6A/cobalt-precorrin-6A reductase, partial [Paraburkholderia sp. SIMBA_050]
GGAAGLAAYLRSAGIGLVIDATHPYAAQISANAAAAARDAGVPLWALRRAPWTPRPGDDWRMVDDWAGIEAALAPFRRPLFTLGREPLAHLDAIPPHQFWVVRCLDPHPGNARAQIVAARGPYTLEGERALFALAVPFAAHAAGCGKPRSAFDQVYCSSNEFSQLDRELNDQYGRVRKHLSGDQQAKLKTSQLAWMKQRDDRCSETR